MLCDYGCGNEAIYKLKNGKNCCNKNIAQCSKIKELNGFKKAREKVKKTIIECKFCSKKINISNIKKHEQYCFLNPKNIKYCHVCSKPIKNYRYNVTCSSKCARNFYAEMYKNFGRNNGKKLTYRRICFDNHKKSCIICKEDKIVSVHHLDENENNNDPENLIPLCPTHHQYLHSRYRNLIIDKINEYINGRWVKG